MCHKLVGHGGIRKTSEEIDKKYENISRSVISLFIELCVGCAKSKVKKGYKNSVVKPLVSDDFNSRGQVDLIDYQSQPDGQYRFGLEFVAEIIRELKSLWPECVIVHGRPRHPQSQGSVERSNQDVEKMVAHWCRDNDSTKWSIGRKNGL